MKIIFTTSKYPTSRLIQKITGDDCSHCGILYDDNTVIHSDFFGVREMSIFEFLNYNKVLHVVEVPDVPKEQVLEKYKNVKYDFGAFFFLGLRLCFPSIIPKQNLWQTSGLFLCTELITEVIDAEEDSMITPHKLYERLVKETK